MSKWQIVKLFLIVPVQHLLQNKLTLTARTETSLTNNLGWFKKWYLTLLWSDSETFFGKWLCCVTTYVVIACCLNECSRPTPVLGDCPALNSPPLRAWVYLTHNLHFSSISIFSLHITMSRIFFVSQCSKRQGITSFWATLVKARPLTVCCWLYFNSLFLCRSHVGLYHRWTDDSASFCRSVLAVSPDPVLVHTTQGGMDLDYWTWRANSSLAKRRSHCWQIFRSRFGSQPVD